MPYLSVSPCASRGPGRIDTGIASDVASLGGQIADAHAELRSPEGEFDFTTDIVHLEALMHANPGRYRLLALVVCKEPLVEKETPMTTHQVQELNAGPKWLADSPLKTVVPTEEFHLIAYVYEFERKSRSDDPALMVSSDLTAEQHLRSTALYDEIEECLSK